MILLTPFRSGHVVWNCRGSALLSKAQLIDDHSISIHLVIFKVVEESPPLSHQFQQTPSGVMIPFMDFKMFCEVSDPLTEKSDLNLWRARIVLVGSIFSDDLLFFLLRN